MVGLALDYRLNFVELVALGTYNRALVEPREVFHMAVHKNSKVVSSLEVISWVTTSRQWAIIRYYIDV